VLRGISDQCVTVYALPFRSANYSFQCHLTLHIMRLLPLSARIAYAAVAAASLPATATIRVTCSPTGEARLRRKLRQALQRLTN